MGNASADDWPPNDIHAMIKEMRADGTSFHWTRVWQYVYLKVCYSVHKLAIPLHEVEDLSQEVLLIVARPGKLESCAAQDRPEDDEHPPSQSFLSWLKEIVEGVCLNRQRYHRRRLRPEPLQAPPQRTSGGSDLSGEIDPPDPHAQVEQRVIVNELLTALGEELRELGRTPWKKSQILRALDHMLNNRSGEEIAQESGRTPGQVRSDTHRIRENLRKVLERYERDVPPKPPKPAKSPGAKGHRRSQKPPIPSEGTFHEPDHAP